MESERTIRKIRKRFWVGLVMALAIALALVATSNVTFATCKTASITSNSPQCFCTNINFDGSASGGTPPYSYSWDFGGAGTRTDAPQDDQHPSYHYDNPGTYTVTLAVTDSNGCTDDYEADVTVNPLPMCSISADTWVCALSQHTATGPDGMSSYSWAVTGGTVDSGADSKTLTYTAGSGPTVTITLDVEDGNGCKNSCQQVVAVSPQATVDAGLDQSTCYTGSPVTFDLTGTAAWIGTLSYLWTGSSGVTITNATTLTPTVSFTGPGTETITLQLTGGMTVVEPPFDHVTDGTQVSVCPQSDTVDLTIHALPTVNAGPDQSTCYTGSPVTFNLTGTATGTGTLSYLWTGSGVTITDATTLTPTVSFTGPGTKTITLTVTDTHDGTACTKSDTADLTIHVLPTVNAGADQSTCYTGSPVTFNLTGTATGTGTLSYLWTGSGMTITNATTLTPTVSFTGPGTKTITLTVTDTHDGTACTKNDTADLTIHALPSAGITPDPATVQVGVGLQFNGNPSGGSGIYTVHSWTGTGAAYLSATDIVDPVFTCSLSGPYILTYTVTDPNGCTGSDAIEVAVTNAPPQVEDQRLTTCKNTPLTITLEATDPEVDPDPVGPQPHPLTFTIYGTPAAGATVNGALGNVTYSEPHTASVVVTYTPAQDFLGEDLFTFLVEDPLGAFAIGTVRIMVEECEEEVAGGGGAILPAVVINEVAWAGTGANSQDEWIELLNTTGETVDLTGWILRWKRKQPATPEEARWKTVELSGTIAPDGFYLLERRHDETVSDIDADLIYDTIPPYPLELVDLGEVMELLDADGGGVDTANADHPERDGWAAGTGPNSVPPFGTMERIDPLSPDLDDNWATNRHIIINGRDALTELLTATAVMINENTLIRALEDATPQTVQQGEQITVTIAVPAGVDVGEGLPQVILARVDEAVGGGGAALAPDDQAAALSGSQVEGLPNYALSLDTSGLAPGTYRLWVSMGNGVFHHLLIEVVEE